MQLYPSADIVYQNNYAIDEEPDFIGMAPNYDKFEGWDIEEVLVFLNVD